jgi:hypothetical protein
MRRLTHAPGIEAMRLAVPQRLIGGRCDLALTENPLDVIFVSHARARRRAVVVNAKAELAKAASRRGWRQVAWR